MTGELAILALQVDSHSHRQAGGREKDGTVKRRSPIFQQRWDGVQFSSAISAGHHMLLLFFFSLSRFCYCVY